jgi:hypothetical protein
MCISQIAAIHTVINGCSLQSEALLRFFGPYLITEKIGSVAYKLQLPASSSGHPIFHVSQLKAAVPVSHSAEPLPDSLDGLQVPVKILQKRVAKTGTAVRLQVLTVW